ncbi:MAG TPA: ArsI/CadI family heavy metal resistance metalloenzyme [Casimicrobiaceae bacterium]|nr:ArsI/CadI family heavy metal resistance metalloenzyme [Casimicrobiaceae bacterium]
MKRFHVHVAVNSIDESVRFYSQVFGAAPSVVKPDFAKWMLEDPRINFAISARGAQAGVNHLGIQVDTDDELKALRGQLAAADESLVEEVGANCCYANSDKYWVTDPQGIAWETYHSLGSIPVFGGATTAHATTAQSACCAPASTPVSAKIPVATRGGCCS